ncbi:MAG: HDIG domain-containing protein [Anaerolineae bacterium]|nr:HDIG domain-containing protein [Anaerolineae bacterium]
MKWRVWGYTAVAATHAARRSRPRDRFTLQFVEPPGGEMLPLPELMKQLRPLFAQESQPVYLVGGAVRDALLGQVSADLDFVQPADAVKLSFRVADALGVPAYVLDKERDTGRVILPEQHTYLDFACFRGSDLEADLLGRDFTINAIALPAGAQTDASLIDPSNGRADLQAKLIRHIHDHSLLDDPVRTLRGLRLALRLGFALAPETAKAITAATAHLHTISNERIRDELLKLLQTSQPDEAIRQMQALGLLAVVLPEIAAEEGVTQSPPHHEDVLTHTISVLRWLVKVEEVLTAVPSTPSELHEIYTHLSVYVPGLQAHWQREVDGGVDGRTLLRLGALYHDVGKPETRKVEENEEGVAGRIRFFDHDQQGAVIAARQLHRLALSNEAVVHVQRIVAGHMRPFLLNQSVFNQGGSILSRRVVYRYFRATGEAGLDIAILCLADHLAAHNGSGEEVEWQQLLKIVGQLLDHYFAHYEETVAPPLLVNGRDLITELHLQPGPEVGRLLRLIQEGQAAGEIHTREEALAFAHRSQA